MSVIRKLEQEDVEERRRGARLESLYRLARALDVQTARLFAPRAPDPVDQDPTQLALLPIRLALTPPLSIAATAPAVADVAEPDLVLLYRLLDQAVRLYHDDRYEATALLLPELIAAAQAGVAHYDHGPERVQALQLRSGVLQLTGWFLTQVGASDLAYAAIKDAIADAVAAGDQLAAAAGVIGECWLFIRQGRLLDALRTAVAAAERIEPRLSTASAAELSAWGWLLLRGASAAVRNNQEATAEELLLLARAAAARVGEAGTIRYHQYWTTFGEATVVMKTVEHRVVIGDWRAALALADRVATDASLRSDNRNRHRLDVAKAHVMLGEHIEAVDVLAGLRASAPSWLRHQRMGREVTETLLSSRKRTLTRPMRGLADFYDLDG